MRAQVKEEGVMIPRQLLRGAEEVEITSDGGVVVVTPVDEPDPILGLGSEPVDCGVTDGSSAHDRHLYGSGK